MGWRYLIEHLEDRGKYYEIDFDGDPTITDVLSGPPDATATITAETRDLFDSDALRPSLRPWKVALYAEADGFIRHGWLLTNNTAKDGLTLDLRGFSCYPEGQPYTDAKYFVEEDPLVIHRHIWDHLQGLPGGDLGVEIDDTTSPVRIGDELEQVQFTAETSPGQRELVSFEAGPYKLNWYQSHDLGDNINKLASDTPFDWHEEHFWDGELIRHRIRRGYPRIGVRRNDGTRLVVGENVVAEPATDEQGDEYATTVIVLGAGEGSQMIRGEYTANFTGLRRAVVIEDKKLTSKAAAIAAAREELARRQGLLDVTQVQVWDHPNAPLSKLQLGDEVPLMGRIEWYDLDMMVRITSKTIEPNTTDVAMLGVQRADLGQL